MKRLGIIAAVAAAWPCVAYAATGIGFLMLSIPVLAIGLVPIITVEAPFIARTDGAAPKYLPYSCRDADASR